MAALATAPAGYYTFGGGSAEVTRGKTGPVATRYDDGSLMEFTIWDAQVGGNQITDLLDFEGNVLPGTVSPIPDPESIDEGLILFYAPDPYAAVFLDRGIAGSVRIALWAREVAASMPVFIDKAQTALDNSTSALSQITEAVDDANAAAAKADGVATQQDQWMGQSATIGQLSRSVFINRPGVTSFTLGVAMFPEVLADASLLFDALNVAASDTNYWTASLVAVRGGVEDASPMVSKTTSTSGEAITANKAWGFAGATFDATAKKLATGDALRLKFTATGTPGTLSMPITASWRVQPQ